MKKIIFTIMMCLPMTTYAQNVWERPDTGNKTEQEKKEKPVKNVKDEGPNPDAPYLAGAVTEKDGSVQWTLDLDIPGRDAQSIYDTMLKFLNELTKEENQLEGSTVALVNKKDHIIVATIREWLVFKDNFLSLDRTKFLYTLMANCQDGHLTVDMNRVSFRYKEKNDKETVFKAEEWISDKYALNKSKTKLYKGSAKFRRKSIDRKEFLFNAIKNLFK